MAESAAAAFETGDVVGGCFVGCGAVCSGSYLPGADKFGSADSEVKFGFQKTPRLTISLERLVPLSL